MEESHISRKHVDEQIKKYYICAEQGESYEDEIGISRFIYWCLEQQYDTEEMMADLNADPNDSELVGMLSNSNFPCSKQGQEKTNEIYYILNHFLNHKDPYNPRLMYPNVESLAHEKLTSRNIRYIIKPKRLTPGNKSKEQIDIGLSRYYAHRNIKYFNDDGAGKFIEWCEENGFEDEEILNEKLSGHLSSRGEMCVHRLHVQIASVCINLFKTPMVNYKGKYQWIFLG